MKPRRASEDERLTDYVLDYYSHFANRFEQDLMRALRLDLKQVLSESPLMRHKLGKERDEIIARITNPEVLAWFELGPQECRRRIRDRILKDHAEDIFLNKCPACHRLVRTPVAQMCVYCGKSWHAKNEDETG